MITEANAAEPRTGKVVGQCRALPVLILARLTRSSSSAPPQPYLIVRRRSLSACTSGRATLLGSDKVPRRIGAVWGQGKLESRRWGQNKLVQWG